MFKLFPENLIISLRILQQQVKGLDFSAAEQTGKIIVLCYIKIWFTIPISYTNKKGGPNGSILQDRYRWRCGDFWRYSEFWPNRLTVPVLLRA